MLRHPALKAHLKAGVIPGEGVILVSEGGSWTLHGALFEQVLPLLDGVRSPEEIAAALHPAKPLDIYYALEFMERKGHLADRVPGLEPSVEAFWTSLDLEPNAASSSCRSGRVRVRSAGGVDAAPLSRSLTEAGLQLTDGDPTLEVVITDDYLRTDLLGWAAAARAANRGWMVLRPTGREFWIGPVFPPRVPGGEMASPCFGCLQHRLRQNQQAQEFLRSRHGWLEPLPTAVAAFPASVGAACQLAAVEIAKVLAGAPRLVDHLLSLDTGTWETKRHTLVRYPSCPLCGDPPQERQGEVHLQARVASPSEGSGHRSTPPEATLEKYGHLISPITGLVTSVESSPGVGGVFQVCVGGANGAVPKHSLQGFKAGLRHRSGGKGPTLIQARASALAETLERYSAAFTGSEVQIIASYRELGERAIHPNAVMGYSDRQYRERDAWNARSSPFNSVPPPLDPDLPVPWTPVWSLTEQREKLLPTQFLYFPGPTMRAAPNPPCCRGCSNGNAAGNNLEEAVLQGFMELVERDATAIWWYNRLRRPGVDFATFGSPYFAELTAHYEALDRDLWALDLTHDLGIPMFAALSCRKGTHGHILFGLGCSLDPEVALLRACAELNQFVALAHTATASPVDDPETLHWLATATLESEPYLVPDPQVPLKRREDFSNAASCDLLTDIQHCQGLVEARNMQMLVLDLTRADAGMAVAKVIVPGLRHFWARYAPGRLYEVPVALGWLARPLTEAELNPYHIFI